jgi:hypothetical protein
MEMKVESWKLKTSGVEDWEMRNGCQRGGERLKWEHIVKQHEAWVCLDVSCDELAGWRRGFQGHAVIWSSTDANVEKAGEIVQLALYVRLY